MLCYRCFNDNHHRDGSLMALTGMLQLQIPTTHAPIAHRDKNVNTTPRVSITYEYLWSLYTSMSTPTPGALGQTRRMSVTKEVTPTLAITMNFVKFVLCAKTTATIAKHQSTNNTITPTPTAITNSKENA
eukprot:m.108438 g.108438  ORF g.108438 m.108438 type:complete len:130 (-) comp9189_c0_seq12:69-458(-)